MVKLVDLLAKYLVEWPKRCEIIVQDEDKECKPCECECADIESNAVWIRDSPLGSCFYLNELASDWDTAKVTYGQWISARDRLHAETVKEMREPTNADTDQALWDKVAIALAPAVYSECCKTMDEEGYPENWREGVAKGWILTVDAFMAERAKRLKGGV